MVHTIELGGYSRSLYALTTDCGNAGTSTAVTPCRAPSDYMYTSPCTFIISPLPIRDSPHAAMVRWTFIFYNNNNNNSRYNYSYSEVTT